MVINKKKFSFAALLLSLSLVFVTAGCGSNNSNTQSSDKTNTGGSNAKSEGKLNIEVSFYPMYEFTKNVAGDLADVHTLVPGSVEPHDWEPTPQDIASIEKADVIVYNGAGMEGWIDQVLAGSGNDKLVKVEASKGIEVMDSAEEEEHDHEHAADEEEHDHDHGGLDPHVWLSPVQAIKEVRNIEAGLVQAAPAHKDEFKKNADAYVAKLEQLDQDFKDTFNNAKRKDFITQHAAFGYLARDYGLEQVAIAGLSPEQEPSASKMAEIVKFAKEHNTKTIFFETLVSSKVAETVANEIGAKSAVLNPIEGLTEEDKAKNLDYIALMRQNLEALKQALNE
ncbi:zinc ABC transporter substrate-binding protein [Paenibacillus sp. CAA11]|uniref:metal ABC transporter substrate-binding protein n=1 Tax=Paenibacillus sp. CAA11 TaxID=1532905 RepID=UPI000D369D36|nr:metal ABC transporter substrate-binding protein [Paenibacillus sp. CAA11]AWB44492.1 zinc ABC transporter substrate-binding protein [Paenibacillus sp. CAA11]